MIFKGYNHIGTFSHKLFLYTPAIVNILFGINLCMTAGTSYYFVYVHMFMCIYNVQCVCVYMCDRSINVSYY